MIELKGKYNTAIVFTDNVEETAVGQIIELCNQEFVKDLNIKIMPDTHAGAGCTIGTTMTIKDKIVPNLVGVDIGCGMHVAIIDKHKSDVDFQKLDNVIRRYVPSGHAIRSSEHSLSKLVNYSAIKAPINLNRAKLSVGTLGGGNHFIELNEDESGFVYIVIHSGSRNLGKQIAEHYQAVAFNEITNQKDERQKIIDELKSKGQQHLIQKALQGVKPVKIKKELAYLEGQSFDDYMSDMAIAQEYADLNRKAMMQEIVINMGWNIIDNFTSVHNYIDMKCMIMRKGAISARDGERVIIPLNMRDGSIIGYGKGNPDWNYSGPHGAGRVMSRSKAKQKLNLEDFESTMKNVWTSSVNESTLDEAPMVYKPMNEILENIEDTVEVTQVIRPLYNFKASN